MKKMRNLVVTYIALVVIAAISSSCLAANRSKETRTVPSAPISEWELKKLLDPVGNWPATPYEKYNTWDQMVVAAKTIQKCSPKSVASSLRLFQLQGKPSREFYDRPLNECDANDSKLFLLMRVIFELPESVQDHQLIMFGGWIPSSSLINSNGTVDQSWPIKWSRGRPQLIGYDRGMEGFNARYDAGAEFMAFFTNYPMRDLTTYQR